MYTSSHLPPVQDHSAYRAVFAPDRMTVGLMAPIESYTGDTPTMRRHGALAQAAEAAGFAALWVRDVPLRDPNFGDVGQGFETFSYLGWLAAQTSTIALGTAATILPLRHPLHTAKAAASIDQLSGGRLLLGVASGDRAQEYSAFGRDPAMRADMFRQAVHFMKAAWSRDYPVVESDWGSLHGLDLVPKATTRTVPLLVTGRSQQDLRWIAENSDGLFSYPRSCNVQRELIAQWRAAVTKARPGEFLPFAQSLYIDLAANAHEPPSPIHLGWRLGRHALRDLLQQLAAMGVNHVALNLKYGRRPAADVVDELAQFVLPEVPIATPEVLA
ncbi:LLM class oxidoreductase [Ramlibacter albus]|uniref:LLM class oxidoreductase n=1 Tax=Ramlibacter albus TaxID=2079448 RepID=A0A923MAU6_9BURK|nr:LLM class oxidoreductase [Ramlibacter albus]MBC5767427.1 LLM class oxidoreductase [Ramlibacter albus]